MNFPQRDYQDDGDAFRGLLWGTLIGALIWLPILWALWDIATK